MILTILATLGQWLTIQYSILGGTLFYLDNVSKVYPRYGMCQDFFPFKDALSLSSGHWQEVP